MPAPGAACGICLQLVDKAECPSIAAMEQLPNCDRLHAVGELCEGDGECGTSKTANNCHGNGDVYHRCTSSLHQPPWAPPSSPAGPPPPCLPPSPPQPPLPPLSQCGATQCDASECGACLRLVNQTDAPACPGVEVVDALPKCIGLRPGELCEGDGECGTSKTANNCHDHRDVYTREACVPEGLAPAAPATPGALALGLALGVGSLLFASGLALWWMARRSKRGRGPVTGSLPTQRSARAVAGTQLPGAVLEQGSKAEALVPNAL